ncbi:MAG: ASKHA domain-containing protein [Anaerolineae bacterium]|jgi:uncharacterized 2Fe-2S/4Fe-4S cluster protein (DUF4445 family)
MANCRVRFQPADREIDVPSGTLLSDAAQQAGVDIQMPCGGQGRCGRCAVVVEEGRVRRLSTGRLAREDVAKGYALACRTAVEGDVDVTVPPQEKIERRLETGKRAREVELPFRYTLQGQPLRKFVVTLAPPSLEDQRDDWSRLKGEMARRYGLEGVEVSLPVLRKLGPALREGEWTVTVVVELDSWHRPAGPPRLIDVLPGEHLESLWAVAMDIGTTSNVVWLVDLISGRVMSQQADYNGQIARGEDVISRIIYASKQKYGQEELQRLVVETFNRLLGQAAEERGIRTDEIYKAVVAGNSTMLHLFAAIPPDPIRLMPFITAVNQLPPFEAWEVGLAINPAATVDCLPGIASYVGADITAGVLSSGMCDSTDKLTLFVDVGTNGEMVLGDCSWLIACACSAGPAFEGAGVVDGMRATAGAIEEVWIDPATYEATYRVIGDEERASPRPRGLCGSGLISLMAEMFTAGVIDKSGNVNNGLPTERVREGRHGYEYVIAWGDSTASGDDIVITDVDLDNLMRAKAAIYAGFSILARSVGLTLDTVERVLIGGAFGQYIDVEKAIQIGLLPDMPYESFHFLGNTSVRGAYMALLSREMRQRVAEVGEMMTYLELSADNTFFDEFNAALFLPHTDASRFPSLLKSAP